MAAHNSNTKCAQKQLGGSFLDQIWPVILKILDGCLPSSVFRTKHQSGKEKTYFHIYLGVYEEHIKASHLVLSIILGALQFCV